MKTSLSTTTGMLALTLSPSADLVQMAGQTFDLFDWSIVLEPTNVFSRIKVPDGRWDLGQIYVTGEVVLMALPGDANGEGRPREARRLLHDDLCDLSRPRGSGSDLESRLAEGLHPRLGRRRLRRTGAERR